MLLFWRFLLCGEAGAVEVELSLPTEMVLVEFAKRRFIMRYFITILSLTIAAHAALAQDSWVGKTILTKTDGIKISYTDEQGRKVFVGELRWPSYSVIGDQGGWLKVTNEHGISGWFHKSEAVLLDDAPAYYTGLIRSSPNDADAYFMRAIGWKLKGESEQALADLNEAIRINPYFAGAFGERALLWNEKKEYAKAIPDYSQAIRLNPNAVGYTNRGYAYRRIREYAKARADFEAAMRIDPQYVDAYDGLAWMLSTCPEPPYRDGNRAVALANKGLELDSNNASLMDTLAAAYAETGEFVQAVAWQERALQNRDWNTPSARGRLELYRNKEPYRQDP